MIKNASNEEMYKADAECLREVLKFKNEEIKHLKDLLGSMDKEVDTRDDLILRMIDTIKACKERLESINRGCDCDASEQNDVIEKIDNTLNHIYDTALEECNDSFGA